MSKLTPAQAQEIRRRYQPRKVTQAQLAEEYGVSPSLINAVLSRRLYAIPRKEQRHES